MDYDKNVFKYVRNFVSGIFIVVKIDKVAIYVSYLRIKNGTSELSEPN